MRHDLFAWLICAPVHPFLRLGSAKLLGNNDLYILQLQIDILLSFLPHSLVVLILVYICSVKTNLTYPTVHKYGLTARARFSRLLNGR
jgi:hypothetical protein